ncbi:MAG: major capsid protein [Arizlama microvirus]|nr:MAG: major capsid protein [Arizlama microvirus]
MGLGNRNADHSFAQTPSVRNARSAFNRSHGRKDAFFFDQLYPIFIDEILPGDTCNLNVNAFVRLAPLLDPVMDNMYMDFFFFFVPNRLVWTNWERFLGSQDDPGDSISFTIPQLSVVASASTPGALSEKMGVPLGSGTQSVNALPFRAYNLIWNTWFRDQNLQQSIPVDVDDGPDSEADYTIRARGTRHDYFTSCLPWPQKGTAINLLPAAAPVTLKTGTAAMQIRDASANSLASNQNLHATLTTGLLSNDAETAAYVIDPNGRLELTATAAGTINQLRQAFQVQSLIELDGRSGTRYVELLLAHFGVTAPDFRLQRPEYLGGGQITINSHIVPQTSPTSGSNYQANLAAFATASTAGNKSVGFTKAFQEHGYVIGLACARADVTYQRGIEKHLQRLTRYDYFWPKLQEIGEQAVLNREIWADSTGNDPGVFGYQERYAEYKYKPSTIHGYFASNATGTLDMWHMARKFTACPTLNETFIVSSTPIARALANTSATPILYDAFYQYKHSRVMATYSVPAGLGRF